MRLAACFGYLFLAASLISAVNGKILLAGTFVVCALLCFLTWLACSATAEAYEWPQYDIVAVFRAADEREAKAKNPPDSE